MLIPSQIVLGFLDEIFTLPCVKVIEPFQGRFGSIRANGDLAFIDGDFMCFDRKGKVSRVRLPIDPRGCEPLGPWKANGIAVAVGTEVGEAIFVSDGGPFRRLAPIRRLLHPGRGDGEYFCGTDYEPKVPVAYRWEGRWVRLSDRGKGAEAMRAEKDGTVLGTVWQGNRRIPCYWERNGRRRELPLPNGYDVGEATQKVGEYLFGQAGHSENRQLDVQPFLAALSWQNGGKPKVFDTGYPPVRLGFAKGNVIYGTLRYSAVALRKGQVKPMRATYLGKRYEVDQVLGGAGDLLVCTSRPTRDSKGNFPRALLVLRAK